jgi:hypothetical protein
MVPTLERAELKSLNFTISYPHVRKGVAICPIQHDSIMGRGMAFRPIQHHGKGVAVSPVQHDGKGEAVSSVQHHRKGVAIRQSHTT